MVQLSHPYMTIGKTIALTIQIFVSKIMSLLFNTLSRFIIAFLPRSKCLLISWLQSPSMVVWYPHLFQNFPQFAVIHTVKGFRIVNEAKLHIFLKFPCFLYEPTNVGNLISGSSSFSKSSLDIWKFSVHIPLKPSLKDFEHFLANLK